MTAQVLVTLPDSVYERAQQLAEVRQQEIAEAIAAYLDDTLPECPVAALTTEKIAQKSALQREKSAYIKLHLMLKKQYLGLYVAIYNGNLIDSDSNYGILHERIRSQYPNEVVWMAEVEDEPMQTIVVRSPRLVRQEH